MKILGSDFDNTLFFRNDSETTKKNIAAVKKFISAGNIFCIITGRTYMEIKEELVRLELPYTYMVCGDGAMVFDSTDYCLKTVGLDDYLVTKYWDILTEYGYAPYLEDGYNITTNKDDCIKISAEYTDKPKALELVDKINQENEVYAYASRKHININNKTNDKKYAVLRLAEVANLNIDDFHVIGDDVNDFEMLEAFNASIVKEHNPILDKLNLPVYETLADCINELMNE